MRNFFSIAFLLVALVACTAGFMHGADKQIEYNERAELLRCQNQDAGWAKACRNTQTINGA